MASRLDREFEFYLEHQSEFVAKYEGKYVVIKGDNLLGAYESELEAIEETTKDHELGTFLVQLCGPGDRYYTETYFSNVVFQ